MIDFPDAPGVGDIYTESGTTWRWDGEKWSAKGSGGSQGPEGPPGPPGPVDVDEGVYF